MSSHSERKLTHAENRSKVCLICFQKGSTMRSAESPKNLSNIKEFLMENYDPLDLEMPSGVCTFCLNILYIMEIKKLSKDKEKPMPEIKLPDPIDFAKLQFPSSITRPRVGDTSPCSCNICKIATESVAKIQPLKSVHIIT